MPSEKSIIKIRDLNVIYFRGKSNEVRALEDINLEIYPGEFIIFFGPSGCGKSTLLYAISGLETNITGNIFIDDKDIAKIKNKELEYFHQKKIGMIFQAYYLIHSLSVLKNVVLPQMAINVNKKEREIKGIKLLDHFGVKEQKDKLPPELSGGQRQRVAICRALVNEPDVLLADEPVGNLDSKSSDEVMTLLKELNKNRKKTIILVTHNPAHLSLAHRVFYIKDGHLIQTKVNEAINKEVIEKKKEEVTTVSKDLEMLAKSFSSITGEAGNLLIPFKAKEIVSEVLSNMSLEEVDALERKVENLLVTGIEGHSKGLTNYLDKSMEEGGMGLDKRTAEKIANKIKDIVEEIKVLQRQEAERQEEKQKPAIEKETLQIRHYLFELFDYRADDIASLSVVDEAIKQRLKDEISKSQFQKKIDKPIKQGGAGMDKRIAKKMAKRLELLMLGKYK
ncbi:ABC transporter ATP-binding protein [bacterium]|nr:ABC transporter ATP-binding protein [bacterium]